MEASSTSLAVFAQATSIEKRIKAAKRLAVSTGKLRRLPALHIRPIDLVVFQEPMLPKQPETSSCRGFHAYMPSAFILAVRGYPALPLARQLEHQRYVLPNPLVLGKKLLKSPAPTTDRDRPVSRRSKPSSRTAFIGEQPNPWELLHPQDAMSRHRTKSTISRGVDYVFILSSILGRGAMI